MTFHTLGFYTYIKYKAEWLGVKVMEVSGAYSSQICHNCHKAARKT
ncbi:zinc ribbon domain-containing protein [Candidatus Nitrososphaera gargensis]